MLPLVIIISLVLAIITTTTPIGSHAADVPTINVYLKPAFSSSGTTEQALLAAPLTAFGLQNNLNVVVNMAPSAISSEYLNDIKQRINKKESKFDLYLIEESWTGSFPGAFADLLQTGVSWNDQLLKQKQETTTLDIVDSALVALPFWADYGVLYYRTDILNQYNLSPPRTWNDIENACKTIVAQDKTIQCFVTGFQNETIVASATEWLASSSTTPFITSGQTFNFDDPEFANILTQIRSWMSNGIIQPQVLKYTEFTALEEWLKGNVVFLQGRSSFYYKTFTDGIFTGASSKSNPSWSVSTIPGKVNGMTASTVGGYHLSINSNSLYIKESAKVLQFLTSLESQRNRSTVFGLPSSYKDSYTDKNSCEPTIACTVILGSDLFVRPAGKVIPHWLQIVDVLTVDLNLFFSNMGVNAAVGLQKAKMDVMNIVSGNNGNSNFISASSGSGSVSTPTGTGNNMDNNGSSSPSSSNGPNPGLLTGAILLVGVVIIGSIISIILINRRTRRLRYEQSQNTTTSNNLSNPNYSEIDFSRRKVGAWKVEHPPVLSSSSTTTSTISRLIGNNGFVMKNNEYDNGDNVVYEWAPNGGTTNTESVVGAPISKFDEFDGTGGTGITNPVKALQYNVPGNITGIQQQQRYGSTSTYANQSMSFSQTQTQAPPSTTLTSNTTPTVTYRPSKASYVQYNNSVVTNSNNGGSMYIRRPESLELQYRNGGGGNERVDSSFDENGSLSVLRMGMGNGNEDGSGGGSVTEKKFKVVVGYDPKQMDEMALRPGDIVLLKTAYD
ncbi:hypothetical protein HDU76_006970, partial [Blyttiomyces sp. JEL0837]